VAGKTLTLNAAFGLAPGAESASLAKNDNGTLTFGSSVDNSAWLGNLTVNYGSVRVTGANNLGYTGIVTVANNVTASLLLDGTASNLQFNKNLTLSGTGVDGAGALRNVVRP
jgi:hypothetical protein